MNWIKTNYDQFVLGFMALVLIGMSAYIINIALGFKQTFAGIEGNVVHHNDVPAVDLKAIKAASDSVTSPAKWTFDPKQGSLFVSVPYIVVGGELVDPRKSATKLHPPVPNEWIIDHKLDILDGNILNADYDGDGFTNLDEWKGIKGDGSDSTDPQDKDSHPPYYTKLRLKRYIKQPFRLLFNAYDGDTKKPADMTFQINTVDIRQPSQFLKIGDPIAGTKFKVLSFEFKHYVNSNDTDVDVSELTVQNNESLDKVVLVLGQMANSPDSFALFHYLWNDTQFQVHKDKEFALLPDTKGRYKVIDIKDDEALIQTPTGEKVKVPKDQP